LHEVIAGKVRVLLDHLCVIVADCKAHYERARAAGAVVVNEYSEKEYGGAGYSCHDPEGHLWYFGSYDPWQPEPG
jgi:uncharacterized glyoxalase superfamily protein PhnB